MLLHEMTYVYEVYRQGSFTQAAQVLYISQPSLSQMVRKAERRIGAPQSSFSRRKRNCASIWTTRRSASPVC